MRSSCDCTVGRTVDDIAGLCSVVATRAGKDTEGGRLSSDDTGGVTPMVGCARKFPARIRASSLADKPTGTNWNDCELKSECSGEEGRLSASAFASISAGLMDPDRDCRSSFRCDGSLRVAPRRVRMNGVSPIPDTDRIAELESPENLR